MPLIFLWTFVAGALLLWSAALWLLNTLVADPQAQVLALQRTLHALPVPEAWGPWAVQARDALVNAGDGALLVLAMGLAAVREALPGLAGLVEGLLWALWALGGLLLAAVGAAFHSVIRESARTVARARAGSAASEAG
jgi:hypothetical protein